MTEFRTAEGACKAVNDTLHIERPDTRRGRMWMRIRRNTEQHPGRTSAYILVVSVLLLPALTILFVHLAGVASTIELWYGLMQFVVFPAVILAMIILGIVFGIAFLKSRKVRRREGIETLARPENIPLDDVTKVISVTPVGVEVLFIFFQESDEEVATLIGFMNGMESEIEEAKELFRNHGIPIKSGN